MGTDQAFAKSQPLAERIKWERLKVTDILTGSWEQIEKKVLYRGDYLDRVILADYGNLMKHGVLKQGDVEFPARNFLAQFINDHLKDEVTQQLWWDDGYREQDLYLQPKTLAGALWLQLARAIAEKEPTHYCARCGTLFTTDSPRPNKLYCRDTCRKMANKQRKRRGQTVSS